MYRAGPMILFGLVLTVAIPGTAHAQSSGQSIVEEALKGVKADQARDSQRVQRMIDEDAYCIDVLTQLSAVTRALQSVGIGLLEEHIGHCVLHAAAEGDEAAAKEKVAEATRAIERLVRS